MLLPLACALAYLVLSSRVLVDAKLSADNTRIHANVAFRAWGVRFCVDGSRKHRFQKEKAQKHVKQLRRFGSLILAGVRTFRWGQIDLRVLLGTGDAAETAVASGVVYAFASALLAAAGRLAQSDVRIEPDFRGRRLIGHARCIFSMVPGDIMFAVAKEAVKKTRREGFKWLSTPLRA